MYCFGLAKYLLNSYNLLRLHGCHTSPEGHLTMPCKSASSPWPTVGQPASDINDHAAIIKDEARRLLEYGKSSDGSGVGKQCPYQTLEAFCKSVLTYMENQPRASLTELQRLSNVRQGSNDWQVSTSEARKEHRDLDVLIEPIPVSLGPYDVLARDVPITFDIADQQRAIECVISTNQGFIPGMEIEKIVLQRPGQLLDDERASLVLTFSRPEHANAAIREGLLIGGEMIACKSFSQACRFRQCYRCQQFGHIDTTCNNKAVCGWCTGPHSKDRCTELGNEYYMRCALCDERHGASSKTCKVRQAEYARVRQLKATYPTYYPEPGRTLDEITRQISVYASPEPHTPAYLTELEARVKLQAHPFSRDSSGNGEKPSSASQENSCPWERGGSTPSTNGSPARLSPNGTSYQSKGPKLSPSRSYEHYSQHRLSGSDRSQEIREMDSWRRTGGG